MACLLHPTLSKRIFTKNVGCKHQRVLWQTASIVVRAGEICTGNTSNVGREINKDKYF